MSFLMETQEQALWCWAAVSRSVDRYFSPLSSATQCIIAGEVLSRNDCCGTPGACNKAARLQDALDNAVVSRLKDTVLRRLTFDEIVHELNAHRPICVRVGWYGGGAHFVVISGYNPAGQMVEVKDPFYPDSTMPYDEFVSAYHQGRGQWTATFLVHP